MSKTVFKATKDQILKMAALAANESLPVGLGHLHYDPDRVFTPEDMEEFYDKRNGIRLDYVQGRCLKLSVWRNDEFNSLFAQTKKYPWITGAETQEHYETWRHKYPSYIDLMDAAGITEYQVVGK